MGDTKTATTALGLEIRPTVDSHMAWVRTRLSVERTLMSWARTAVALIGFGFTIVQFFDRMKGFANSAAPFFPEAPRYVGLSLILCGILALGISIYQYQWTIKYLTTDGFELIAGPERGRKKTPLLATSYALIGVGTFAFIAVLLRLV